MKFKALLTIAFLTVSTQLIHSLPVNIKNETGYDLFIKDQNGQLKIVKKDEKYNSGIDHTNFTALSVQQINFSPIHSNNIAKFRSDVKAQPAFVEQGRSICAALKSGYTGWYIELNWGCQ